MEAETSPLHHVTANTISRLLPAVAPVVLISIGYIDPGKWAATIEGGAKFGIDLVAPMLIFSFAAILCQYLSACIGVVTGRDLAQICSDEYDEITHIFLGVQSELSIIALELTMVLGIAHCLSHMFGVDLFISIFFTAIDAVLFPFLTSLLEKQKGKLLCIYMAAFLLICYEFVVIIIQPEVQLSMNGTLTRLSGESAFALMSLLGAYIMPHNFYLHSAIVQQHQGPGNVSKGALCHEHFFAILSIFSSIFLVNCILMNSAANVFYSTGLPLLNFQDAISLMDQVLRSPLASFALLLFLFISSQITALSWTLGGEAVLHNFFGVNVPSWLHRATIRTIAVVPAFFSVWNYGAEGLYQLLVFTQVIVALMLPSSMIPLFRVASSRQIMGAHRVSQSVEFLSMVTFIGVLGLKLIFVVEMIFGNSDWVSNLRWNMGSSTSVPYVVLLLASIMSLCLMLWILATPLKSASSRLDGQTLNWDIPNTVSEPMPSQREERVFSDTVYHVEEPLQKQEASPAFGKHLSSHTDISVQSFDLPETLIDADQEHHLTASEENHSDTTYPILPVDHQEESTSTVETIRVSTVVNEVSDVKSMEGSLLKHEPMDPVTKTLVDEGDLQLEKDDEEGDIWEPEESSRGIPGSSPPWASEGPGSFRSLSGKSDDGGNSIGSLSRLAGLGRAARRQLTGILDEFWGQLYDYHGQATKEAKAKKFDLLLGSELKDSNSMLKMDPTMKEFNGYFPSVGGRGTDAYMNPNIFDPPMQPRIQSSLESSYGVQKGSVPLWSNSNTMQLLDAYVQNSGRNALDSGERRYSSLRLPPSTDSWDYQPATVHGYQIAQYLNRMTKDNTSDYLSGQMEAPVPKSPSVGPTNYRDPLTFALGQKAQNGLNSVQASRLQNLAVSRNTPLQSERSYYDTRSLIPGDLTGDPVNNTKKYHSLPDISGLSVPHLDSYLSDRNSQWNSSSGFGLSDGQAAYEQRSLYPGIRARTTGPLAFDELSPSKAYRDAFAFQLNSSSEARSLWSRQPFEQFGVADKTHCVGGEGLGSRPTSRETTSLVDLEAQLLQSFRRCILKLLSLEGSDWLFKQNDGADEDLIDRVAAREKFLYEAETSLGDSQYISSDRKFGSTIKTDEPGFTKYLISSVPHCEEDCIWKVDLIISFGVWCTHRILDLSLMESRPELWGKYTYVLNRLQGIIDLAFSKPRTPKSPCFCLQIPMHQQKSSPPISNGMLPPTSKANRGKCTTATMLVDIIKDVEIAISCRKGRPGTAAGDVAFPKGKENLASVLKRYKRRLASKTESAPGSRKFPASTPYGS